MPARVTVIAGPARSGKTESLLVRYRQALAGCRPGNTLWLAPTWRAAADVRERLLSGGLAGCLGPGVMTFEQFAEAVLEFAPQSIRPLSRLMKRQLLRRLIDGQRQAGRLAHFGPIAGTSGLVDLVDQWISELKRLEIWPEHFREACQARGLTDKDRELLDIYEAYQNCLREHNLYDAEGRFWSARTLLEEGQQRPFERLELVAVDGFTDFTRTQHEILDILAGRAEALVVTLPLELDTPPRRQDLFAKPRKTLDQLRKRHPDLSLEAVRSDRIHAAVAANGAPAPDESGDYERLRPRAGPEQSDWPAVAHLEEGLFGNPRRARPAESTAGIEILAASRELGEIELIGARIKQLLTEGCPESGGRAVPPGEVAVVFRSTAGADALVREVFRRLGIPVRLESGRTLDHATGLVALVGLLRLENEDWPFRALLAVLASSYFRPGWPEWQEGRAAVAADRVVRQLQVPRGRDKLIERIERLAEAPLPDDPDQQPAAQQRTRTARLAQGLLGRLRVALDALPQRATLGQWADAWTGLADQTGLLQVIDQAASQTEPRGLPPRQSESPGLSRRGEMRAEVRGDKPRGSPALTAGVSDRLAWDQLQEALRAGDRLWEWMGQSPPELDRREALAALVDILGSVRLRESGDETGHVCVLSARSVRALRVPYLFLAGLSERAFPPPDREDRLYGETEAQRLMEEGLPLVARTERSREEMLLFYEAVTRATRRLTLSYPALDERAQPLSPSPYLQAVEQACGPGRIQRTEVAELSPVPSGEPLSDVDFRVQAVATALAGNVSLLAGLLRLPLPPGEGWGEGGLAKEPKRPHPNPLPEGEGTYSFDHLPEAEAALGENILAGLLLVAARGQREGFGPAEGMLAGEGARAELASRFGPERTFSATELERYAGCPFRFYLQSVLGLEPVEDLALAVDYLARGRLAHEALAVLHAQVNRLCGQPASPASLNAAEYERLLGETLRQVLARPAAHPIEAALREVDRRLLVAWLADFRRQQEEYDALWGECDEPLVPAHFEVSFGRAPAVVAGLPTEPPARPQVAKRRGQETRAEHVETRAEQTSEVSETSEVSSAIEPPLEITAAGQTVRLSGRIDRVDTGRVAGRTVFNVLDYKTGASARFSPQAVAAGTALQLPLYALAVQRLLLADRQAVPWQAGYWYLKDNGFKPKAALKMHRRQGDALAPEPGWEEIRRTVAETVVALADGIRRAEFPVSSADPHCTRNCPFSTVCRINQVRALEKTWQPTSSQD